MKTEIEKIISKLDRLIERGEQQWPRWLTVEKAADYSSLSVGSIRRALSTGKLTSHRLTKGRILIDRFELDSQISSSTSRPRKGRGLGRKK